jgi:2'-5' RNA ligase
MRAFFCLPLPSVVREQIARAASSLRKEVSVAATWVAAENYHVTLRFLGEIDPMDTVPLERLTERISERIDPFLLSLNRLGAFPSAERARVLWVGGESPEAFVHLARDLNGGLAELGFDVERKPAVAHVTIARLKSLPPVGLATLLADKGRIARQQVTAERIVLMESRLGPRGATYLPLFEKRLGGR